MEKTMAPDTAPIESRTIYVPPDASRVAHVDVMGHPCVTDAVVTPTVEGEPPVYTWPARCTCGVSPIAIKRGEAS
jgi:hypothetical protein